MGHVSCCRVADCKPDYFGRASAQFTEPYEVHILGHNREAIRFREAPNLPIGGIVHAMAMDM